MVVSGGGDSIVELRWLLWQDYWAFRRYSEQDSNTLYFYLIHYYTHMIHIISCAKYSIIDLNLLQQTTSYSQSVTGS